MKSTTEHRLETCIHSDTCLPGYSIDHNLVIGTSSNINTVIIGHIFTLLSTMQCTAYR